MRIRLARPSDNDELCALFRGASFTREDLVSKKAPDSGFYEYPLTHSDIAMRTGNPPFSLVMEDRRNIIVYLLGYDKQFASERVALSEHTDPVIERFSRLPNAAVYLDQLFLQRGLPIFHASLLMDTWDHIVQGEKIEFVVASLPQGDWTNRSSLRFALDRGFSRKDKVNSLGVQLGVFSKPYLNLDEEFKL